MLGIDEVAAMQAWTELRQLGLEYQLEQSLAGGYTLTEKGIRIARSIRTSRASGAERWNAVERAIAQTLIKEGRINAPFTDEIGDVDGTPVTEIEAHNAIIKLERWGMVNVIRADQGIVVVHSDDPLHQVPGIDGLLTGHFEGRTGATYNNSTNTTWGDDNTVGAFQAGGQNNTQNATGAISIDTQAQVLTRVGALLRTLDEADTDVDDLRAAVEAVKDEAVRDGATKLSLKDRVVQALLVAGGSEAGNLIAQGLAQLLGVVS